MHRKYHFFFIQNQYRKQAWSDGDAKVGDKESKSISSQPGAWFKYKDAILPVKEIPLWR